MRSHVETLESRTLLSAGNILVTGTSGPDNSAVITEYTQGGNVVRTIGLPGGGSAKDVIVDAAGRIDVFDGASPLELAVYNGSTWSFHQALNWSLFGVTYEGKIAAYNNYVYVESQSTGANKGIVRFDAGRNYAAQLYTTPDDREIDDVNMGLDGKLYSTAYNSFPANDVVQWDPNTMKVLKTIHMSPTYGGNDVAVDAKGDLYIVGDNYLYKMTPAGTVLNHIVLSGSDIKNSTDGKLLVSSGGRTEIIDQNLNVLGFFNNEGSVYGSTFASWNTYQAPSVVPPPPTTGTIAGNVFGDLNGDGKTDGKDAGLAGWLVYVDSNNDGQFEPGESYVLTDKGGNYTLKLKPGSYRVRAQVRDGYYNTAPHTLSFLLAVKAGGKYAASFGEKAISPA